MPFGLPEFSDELKEALKHSTKYLEETIKRGLTNASVQRTSCFLSHQNNNNVTRSTKQEPLTTDSNAMQHSHHVESSENECSSADNDDDDGDVNSSVGIKALQQRTTLQGNVSNKNGNEFVGNMKSRNLYNNNSSSSGSNSLNNHATRLYSGGGGAAGYYGNKYTIEHVAFNVDENTYVSLRNIKLTSMLDIRVAHLEWDTETMSMACELNLGTVCLESHYESTNEALAMLLPVYNEGKLVITLEDVKASGIVGLYIHGDYFVPTLYDFNYTTTETHVRVEYPQSYYHPDTTNVSTSEHNHLITSEIVSTDVETTIVRKFWRQIISIFNNIIVDQLENILKEISITELLNVEPEFVAELKYPVNNSSCKY